jgi:hypothetical protein
MIPYTETALNFATSLVAGDYDAACMMLSPSCSALYPPETLQENLAQMIAYSGQNLDGAGVGVDATMDEWPEKQAGDVGWAYVSIFKDAPGVSFAEAVTVIVTEDGLIRDIVWGRP